MNGLFGIIVSEKVYSRIGSKAKYVFFFLGQNSNPEKIKNLGGRVVKDWERLHEYYYLSYFCHYPLLQ